MSAVNCKHSWTIVLEHKFIILRKWRHLTFIADKQCYIYFQHMNLLCWKLFVVKSHLQQVICMGVGSWVLKILAKKVVLFPVGKTFHHYWAPLEKFWKNPLVPSPWNKSFRHPCVPDVVRQSRQEVGSYAGMGVGRIVSRVGAKLVKIDFSHSKHQENNLFCWKFQNPGGGQGSPFRPLGKQAKRSATVSSSSSLFVCVSLIKIRFHLNYLLMVIFYFSQWLCDIAAMVTPFPPYPHIKATFNGASLSNGSLHLTLPDHNYCVPFATVRTCRQEFQN